MSEKLEAREASGVFNAPILEEAAPFSATRREQLAALVMYALAWLYAAFFMNDGMAECLTMLTAFAAGFIAMTEWLHWRRPRGRESWVWLGCMLATLCGILLDGGELGGAIGSLRVERSHVWAMEEKLLFLHGLAIWWALSRGGALAEGQTGHLLPLDAVYGVLVLPFTNLLLRARMVLYALTHIRSDRSRVKPEALAWSALALLAAAGLFALAFNLLTLADSGFAGAVERALGAFSLEIDEGVWWRLLLSLPVGAYLYGMIAGAARESADRIARRRNAACQGLEKLRRVPNKMWAALMGGFALLYLLFFVVQGRYLFGAFTRTLPAGFIVSQYARQGFFELCQVMAVNLALLWLATRTAAGEARQDRPTLILCLILLAQSLLFAAVALSKLALYIDCFGFTPLRLQSTWLVCVLAVGCVCAAISLLRAKKTFRAWAFFAAITLSLLCLY
ncbi:MAG: DUF4173 domain-containing protein [Clostridia bacterium]|nr:DUF4173 domain-containing protein [Clostridia bacterium]